jgi:nicotinamidase-related amidase
LGKARDESSVNSSNSTLLLPRRRESRPFNERIRAPPPAARRMDLGSHRERSEPALETSMHGELRDFASQHASEIRASPLALLLIDVINPMDFDGASDLLPPAIAAARRIERLSRQARRDGIPVIYVNDNFDCWHLGFRELVEMFRQRRVPGLPIIEILAPAPESDFYVLKPSHSGFFRTGLEVLLERLEARTLILTGFAGDICVLFTANDAYMRGFRVVVPADCVASERAEDNDHALAQMARLLKADTTDSGQLNLQALRDGRAAGR